MGRRGIRHPGTRRPIGFDIAVLLIVGVAAIFGFLRGFVHEVLAILAWLAAVAAIRTFHEPLTLVLRHWVGTQSGASVLTFALLALVPYFVVRMIARWAGGVSRGSLLGPVDRMLGLGFGGLKGMIMVVFLFSLAMLGYDTIWGVGGRPAWVRQSRTYPVVNAASNELVTILAARRRAATEAEARASASDAIDGDLASERL